MTLEQMKQLLATIAGYDGRAVDARTIYDWHAILKSIPFELAHQSVRLWYAENRGYIQPHDVAATAARVAGLDQQPTVTQQRLEGRELPWDRQGLAAPWQLPGFEHKAELPIHRTEAGWPNCATCDGGGCPDCTDPA